jgi:hypothetical protein
MATEGALFLANRRGSVGLLLVAFASVSIQPLCCATTVHRTGNHPAAVWSFLVPSCGKLWGVLHSKHLNLLGWLDTQGFGSQTVVAPTDRDSN